MNYFHTIFIALLLHCCVAQAWCANNMEVRITVTINTAPTITQAITIDSNGDGFLDQIQLSFDQLVSIDDSFGASEGLSGIVLSNGYQISPADYSATDVMSLTLNLIPGAVPDTGVTPIVSFAPNAGTNIRSTATGLDMDNNGLISTDGADPVLISAESDIGSDLVTLRFSEPGFSRSDASGLLDLTDLQFNNNSGNAGPNLLSLVDDDASDLLISLRLDSPLAASDFGSDSVEIFDNSVFDAIGLDTGNTSQVLQLRDNTDPKITFIQTRDRDKNGFIDAILISFDENIDDSSVNPNDFIINGTGTLGLGTYQGEYPNDGSVLLTFSDDLLDSGETPQTSYVAGSITDLAGNNLQNTSPSNAIDRAGPAIIYAETISTTQVRVTLSEPIDDNSLQGDDFFFNGFLSPGGNGLGIAVDTDGTANDTSIIVTLPGTITPDETGLITFDSPHVVHDLPGNWNEQHTAVAIADGNGDSGPGPDRPFAPRIVSEARLWTLEDEEWRYDVEVDIRELIDQGHLGLLPQYSLNWELTGNVPSGMTITKTGALTARITWPRSAGNNEHVRITVEVNDDPTSTEDKQDVMIHIIDQPSAGN